jgi:hypothetical protein
LRAFARVRARDIQSGRSGLADRILPGERDLPEALVETKPEPSTPEHCTADRARQPHANWTDHLGLAWAGGLL